MRKRYRLPACASAVTISNQPSGRAFMGSACSRPSTVSMSSIRWALGAQRRKRTPASLNSAPNGMECLRQTVSVTRALNQERDRASLQCVRGAARVVLARKGILRKRSVEHRAPCALLGELRQRKGDGFVMRVEEREKIHVFDVLPAPVDAPDCRAGEIHTEAARELLLPFRLGHFAAIGREPHDLLGVI